MNDQSDSQLLRAYVDRRSETAFAELVRRHVDIVYSAALRMVSDAHLAEDVTQAAFAALARNASQLSKRSTLSGWLHRTTQNIAAQTVRTEVRRRAREQEAAAMNELPSAAPDPPWGEIAPHLDAALGELSESDRDAVLLRYFQRKSAREMADILGVSDEAAQRRVTRAVERLREFFAKRGISVEASGLVAIVSANAIHAAPVGLALTISTALTGTTVAAAATTTVTKAIAMTTFQKTLATAALVVLAGIGIYEARRVAHLREQVRTLQTQFETPSVSAEDATRSALQDKLEQLTTQNAELTSALARANADRYRLETEREQARRAAALYEKLVEQANAQNLNPTNKYPTRRHVWVGFGHMGRLMALAKDDSGLSAEEKSTLEAAKTKALADLPSLVMAAKQYDTAKSVDWPSEELMDEVACLLYGALNLNEQQFSQAYGVMQQIGQEANQKGLSKETPAAEAREALKLIMEQWKAQTQTLLTPEQARIFAELVTHFQVEPGKFGFNFNF